MEIKDMTMEDIEARMSEIKKSVNETEDFEAINAEIDALNERKAELKAAAIEKRALAQKVAEGAGNVIKTFEEDNTMEERIFNAESPEYRTAFLKTINGEHLTDIEERAYVATTGNTAAVLPSTMLNQIWSLITETHALLRDVTVYRYNTIIELVKHTAIAAGDAAVVEENAANDDEQNTFVKVTLKGKDFSKSVDITYALAKMSIDALEQYLVSEIADRLGVAINNDIYAQIGTDMTSGNKVTKAGTALAWSDITGAFAKIKRAASVNVYCTRATLYGKLASLVDSTGRPIFQPSAQAGAEGTLLGAPVKIDDSVAADKLLIGDPKKVVCNFVQDIMIESDRDIKKHVITYSGYARCESVLMDPDTFALLTC